MKNIYVNKIGFMLLCLIATCAMEVHADTLMCDGWNLEYRQAPDGVKSDIIITKATGSGQLDLTKLTGYRVIGALPSAFAYNSSLTSINLPASMTTLRSELADVRHLTGEGEPYEVGHNIDVSKSIGLIDLDYNLNAQPVQVVLDVTTDGSAANQYGCCLLASGTLPFEHDEYAGGFQIFMENNEDGAQTITVKDGSSVSGTKFDHAVGNGCKVGLYYNPHYGFLMVSVKYADGKVDTVSCRPDSFSVSTLCYGLPKGVNESVSISDACMPFAGCSGLKSVTVEDGGATYANGEEGVLLNADGSSIAAYPYGQLFDKVVRIGSVANPGTCMSVDAYDAGGYQNRSATFEDPNKYFGTTLMHLEANDNGTCSIRHLNTGFLLGRKSDNTSTTLDVVQDAVYSGQFDYTLVPGSPLEARFVFTDPYMGPVGSFDGVWCITDVNGSALMQQNPEIAGTQCSFRVQPLDEVMVPVNSNGMASVVLPVDVVAPEQPIMTMSVTGFDSRLDALVIAKVNPGDILKAGTGLLYKCYSGVGFNLKIHYSDETAISPVGNILTPTYLQIPQATGTNYLLYNDGYKRQTGGRVTANAAYLSPSSSLPATALSKDFLNIAYYIYTGVETPCTDSVTPEDMESTPAYDISGVRVDPSAGHGRMIIQNGKVRIGK